MQWFFILLSAALCVGFVFRLCKLAGWQPQLQPTCLEGSSLDLRANPGAQTNPQKRLALIRLPWVMCLPLSQSLTTGEADALDQTPSLSCTLSLGWGWWEALPMPQNHRGWRWGGVVPHEHGRLLLKTEWMEKGWPGSHTRPPRGSRFPHLYSVRSSHGPGCWCQKPHSSDRPPDGAWVGLGEEGILLLFRMTKLIPFNSSDGKAVPPGTAAQLLVSLWECHPHHTSAGPTPLFTAFSPSASLRPPASSLSTCVSLSFSLHPWPPLSPVWPSLLPVSVSLSLLLTGCLCLSICLSPSLSIYIYV